MSAPRAQFQVVRRIGRPRVRCHTSSQALQVGQHGPTVCDLSRCQGAHGHASGSFWRCLWRNEHREYDVSEEELVELLEPVAPHTSPSLRPRRFYFPVAPTRANVDGRRLLAAATKEGPSP